MLGIHVEPAALDHFHAFEVEPVHGAVDRGRAVEEDADRPDAERDQRGGGIDMGDDAAGRFGQRDGLAGAIGIGPFRCQNGRGEQEKQGEKRADHGGSLHLSPPGASGPCMRQNPKSLANPAVMAHIRPIVAAMYRLKIIRDGLLFLLTR